MSDVDEVGSTDNASNDNEKDSDEENDDADIDSIDAIQAQDDIGEFDARNQLYVLEMILSFHAWYKCGSPYFLGSEQVNKMIDKGIWCMLSEIKKYIPHNESNGWKLQKFHDMLHILQDMQMFGCPQN